MSKFFNIFLQSLAAQSTILRTLFSLNFFILLLIDNDVSCTLHAHTMLHEFKNATGFNDYEMHNSITNGLD